MTLKTSSEGFDPIPNVELSERELQILQLVATGAGNKEIGQQLAISPNTVRVHLRNIFAKINVGSRTEAAMYAVRLGLLTVPPGTVPVVSVSDGEEAAPVAAAPPPAEALTAPAVLPAPNEPVAAEVVAVAELVPLKEVPAPSEPVAAEVVAVSELVPPTPEIEPAAPQPVSPVPPPTAEVLPAVGLSAPAPNPPPMVVVPPVKSPAFPWPWLTVGVVGLLVILFGLVWWGNSNGQVATTPTTTPLPAPTATPLPRWTKRAELTTARSGFAAVAYDNQIYAIGGETATGPTTIVERYDPARNLWEALPPLPMALADIGAAVVGGKIYVPGGRLDARTLTTTLWVYDPLLSTWATRAPLPAPRSAYALVAFEGRLFLFGGWDGTAYQATVWEYNPATDEWLTRTPMLTARASAAATMSGDKIYVLGGTAGQGALNANEIYNPAQEASGRSPWNKGAPLPVGRWGLGAVTVADLLHVLGGYTDDGTTAPSFKYVSAQNEWQTLEAPPEPLGAALGVVLVGTEVYAFGGEQSQQPTGALYAYQALYTTSLPLVGGE